MKALPSVFYPTDLTDREWVLLEPLLLPPNQADVRAASISGSFSTVCSTCCAVAASGGYCRARTVLGPRSKWTNHK